MALDDLYSSVSVMVGHLDKFRQNWKEDARDREKWKKWREAFAQEWDRAS